MDARSCRPDIIVCDGTHKSNIRRISSSCKICRRICPQHSQIQLICWWCPARPRYGIFEIVCTGLALTTNATTQRPRPRCGKKIWADDSGATENILLCTARIEGILYGKARKGCACVEATPSGAVGRVI